MKTAKKNPRLSVVVITRNEGPLLRQTVDCLEATLPRWGEIVVVDDASEDGSTRFLEARNGRARMKRAGGLGVSGARNFGARHCLGEVIVFSDAHIETPKGWWEPMLEALRNPVVGAVGPGLSDTAEPDCRGYGLRFLGPDLNAEWLDEEQESAYPVPLLPGGFMAMRRETFEKTGGFDEGMIRRGSEDLEYSLRLWFEGYELWLEPEVDVRHFFRESHPYPVEQTWLMHNQLRLAMVHFSAGRLARVVEALKNQPYFSQAMAMAVDNNVSGRRDECRRRRSRDDDWFFERFGPAW